MLGISDKVWEYCEKTAEKLKDRFEAIDRIAEINQAKVIEAMQKCRVASTHFAASYGYGYNDDGRDTLEKVYAVCFGTEDALVRPQITCGTHALALCLSANLLPGDELLLPAGAPYDTLHGVIGMTESAGSLAEYGVAYRQVGLTDDGDFDLEAIKKAINGRTKLAEIQRSKGYQTRPSFSVEKIAKLIGFIKSIKPDVICMVDNCYGEFVEEHEPTEYGADIMAGSLIKNPGGGLAASGGYIVGRRDLVERCAYRLNAPGLGKEVGTNYGMLRTMYQGLFLAPSVTASALKGAIFAANLYEPLGFRAVPDSRESRHDIIQALELGTPGAVMAFCEGIQAASPVDSFAKPIPGDMPGYDSQVIMAAGAFVQGASIELSADAPMREPYAVYFQGGLTWQHAKLGIAKSLQAMVDKGIVSL